MQPKQPRIHHFFEKRVLQSPDAIAIQYHEHRLTYQQLEAKVNILAAYLVQHFPSHNIIGISTQRSINMVIGVLAIAKANKTYLPLDAALPVERLQVMVTNANLAICLCEEEAFDFYGSIGIQPVSFANQLKTSTINFDETIVNPAYVLYTSGSTGIPKGVEMNHQALVNLLEWQKENSIAGIGTKTLQFSPLSFDVSFVEIFSTLDTGGTLVIVDDDIRLDPEKLLRFIERESINRIFLPYVALQYITDAAMQYGLFPGAIQEMITAGEALRITPSIVRFFQMLPNARLYNQYGPTECHVVTELQLKGDPTTWDALPTIGKPISHTNIYLVDEQLNLVNDGQEGELCIGGIALANGYLNDPEKTAEKFIEWTHPITGKERIYRTGDIAIRRVDGEIVFLGRKDDQVKIRGYRIELAEVEVALNKIEGIRQSIVVAKEDKDNIKKLVAYMEGVHPKPPIKIILNTLGKFLPDYMLPASFVWVDAMPKTPTGKIDKKALPNPNNDRPDVHAMYVPPATELERLLENIWSGILVINNIGINDNFFELGGNSLLAIKTTAAIKNKTGKEFPITSFYRFTSIAAQAAFLQNQQVKISFSSKKRDKVKDVAIIGMNGRFPGAASIETLWNALLEGKETTTFFSASELDVSIPSSVREDPYYVKARGILNDAALFDASFFGIPPALATLMDPQQRIFLEICWELLEQTGHLPEHYKGSIGVYAGSGNNSYYLRNVLSNKDKVEAAGAFNVMTYNEKDYIASRAAYLLNLKGPAVSVYSGCSTSLLAVAQAVEAIRAGYCNVAIAGGVSVTAPIKSGHYYQEGAMLSKDGHCRPFDAQATGTVFSDGAGAVLLKSLEEAVADGNTIYGVVKGIGINNDGYDKASFTAPSAEGQAGAIFSAIQEAGIGADELHYIEAHGTATPLGDPIEINGLALALEQETPDKKIPIGSIKSNIGHLTAAAGVAGLIKSTLVLYHKQLVPSILFETANTAIPFAQTPFFVHTSKQRLPNDIALHAGVSSFGVGGTNVHVVIGNYVANEKQFAHAVPASQQFICWWARTETSLKAYAGRLKRYLQENPTTDLADLAYSLYKTRARFSQTACIAAKSVTELIAQLDHFEADIHTPAAQNNIDEPQIAEWAKSLTTGRLIPNLPGYAFDKKFFWIDPPMALQEVKKQEVVAGPDNIEARLKAIIIDVSGEDESVVKEAIGFMEMGLDSLVLTQLAIQFSKAFEVKISFRQLNDELDRIDLVANFIRREKKTLTPNITRIVDSTPTAVVDDAAEQKSFGPMARIEKSAASLSVEQMQFLKSFIYRYNGKTKQSKNYTQTHRAAMADPRVVSGFKPVLKEIIYPLVVNRSEGSKIWDIDGNEYIDVLNGFGANILGYKHPLIQQAVIDQVNSGYEIGPQHPLAGEVCSLITTLTGNERAALCNTGSEAVLGVMRIARTVTGKTKIVSFKGAYHGINDEIIVRGNTAYQPFPAAPGIPKEAVSNMLVLEYGVQESLEVITSNASDIAAVMVEPIQSRRPEFQPKAFLQALRELTERLDIVLIFDEVITGFRCHTAGVQGLFDIRADLVTYGKVVGGGMPIGVMAGKKKYMDALDGGYWQFGNMSVPETGVTYFAGTFVRHPLALAAAKASLLIFKEEGNTLQEKITNATDTLVTQLNAIATRYQAPYFAASFSSLWKIKLQTELAYAELLFVLMREKGIHIWDNFPCFLTAAHSEQDISSITNAFEESVAELRRAGFFDDVPTNQIIPSLSDTEILEEGVEKIVPLTDAQLEIWMSCQIGETDANLCFNESVSLELTGQVDAHAMEKAVKAVVLRHESLRARCSSDGKNLLIVQSVEPEYIYQDLTGLETAAAQEYINAYHHSNAQTPFDLIKEPLFRVAYFQLNEVSALLAVTAHHIVCDGWSMGIILGDISKCYNAFVTRKEILLPEPVSFAAYALAKTAQAGKEQQVAAEAYWIKKIGKNPTPFLLIGDKERPAIRTYKSSRTDYPVAGELMKQLAMLGATEGSSLTTTLLAVFEILLYKLIHAERIIVGLPAADQPVSGNPNLVGHCVNLLPIISNPNNNIGFTDYLLERRKMILNDLDFQQVSFGKLLEQLQMSREGSSVPLIPIVLNIDTDLDDEVRFEGLEHKLITNQRVCETFDIFLNITGTKAQYVFEWSYNRNLFSTDYISSMMDGLVRLMHSIVANPVASIAALGIYDRAKALTVQQQLNPTKSEFPATYTVHQLFEKQVEKQMNKVAVSINNETLSYIGLNERANRIANYLIAKGIKPGAVIAVCLSRSINMIASLLGVYKAGATYLAIDPEHPPKRIVYLLNSANVAATITEDHFIPTFQEITTTIVLSDVAQSPSYNPSLILSVNSGSFILFTSGSTGDPKGVLLNHRALTNVVTGLQKIVGFTQADKLLMVTTIIFDLAQADIFLPLISGGELIIADNETARNGKALLDLIEKRKITYLEATPVTYRYMLESGWDKKLPIKLTCCGETLPIDLAQKLQTKSIALYNMYGPTENTIYSTYASIKDIGSGITIGKPFPNIQVYILDEDQQPVPIGVKGEIYIGGEGTAIGYVGDDKLTAEKFVTLSTFNGERFFKTGDIGAFKENGDIIFFGRKDTQVKIRGLRIELGEVEYQLRKIEAIKDVAVVVREDITPGTKTLVAYVVTRESGKAIPSANEVQQWRNLLEQELPNYYVPNLFVRLEKLPLTASGKVNRVQLPRPDAALLQGKFFVAPVTETEKKLAKLWEELLGMSAIGCTDNFFELGGHSLIAIQLMSRLRKEIDKQLPISILFQHPTIQKLAILIDSNNAEAPWEVLVPIKPNGTKPPLYVIHGDGLNVMVFRSFAQFVDPEQPVYGLQAMGLMGNRFPAESIEQIASDYLKEVLAHNPNGPYNFAGYSFGGLVAYEMTQQLQKMGKQVNLLGILDTNISNELYYEANNHSFSRKLKRQIPKLQFIGKSFIKNPKATFEYQKLVVAGRIKSVQQKLNIEKVENKKLTNEDIILEKITFAYHNYAIQPIDKEIDLFRCKIRPYFIDDPVYLGWKKFSANVAIRDTEGDHATFLFPPYDALFAKIIQRVLDERNQ